MTYIELGKKVLEQAGKPLSVKEIFEKACEMGLDKERNGTGKTPWSSLGTALSQDKKQFYVINREENPFVIGSNLVKENFLHKKLQMLKKKMMNRASVQTQPKNKKTLFVKGFYTHYL